MKLFTVLIACALMTAPVATAAADPASVNVIYDNPDHFTDAGPHRGASKERDRTLKELEKYMETLGGKYLKPGEALKIEVLDLDLAGRIEPGHIENPDIRFMRALDWPAMKVRYTLTRNETVVGGGEERIIDQNYMTNAGFSTDPLRFEKHMLADWFGKRFGGKAR